MFFHALSVLFYSFLMFYVFYILPLKYKLISKNTKNVRLDSHLAATVLSLDPSYDQTNLTDKTPEARYSYHSVNEGNDDINETNDDI